MEGQNRANVVYVFVNRHVGYVTSGVWGWGGVGGMLTFMLTCGTCACFVTSGVWGWGGVAGDVNVPVNFLHMRMLRHVRGLGLGWGGGGLLTFILPCGTCACYVPSGVGAMKLATALKGSFISKNKLEIGRF